MDIKEILKNKIDAALSSKGWEKVQYDIEIPQDITYGDLATNVAMKLSKGLKKNPLEIAEEIASELKTPEIESLEVVKPGFINFKYSETFLKDVLTEVIDKQDSFGESEINKDKVYLVEHTSPNPNKEFHLGHLKNNVTGLAISYLFEAIGTKVFRDCIDNDRGIAIAKLMWGYLKFGRKDGEVKTDLVYWSNHKDEWHTAETFPEAKNKPDRLMDIMYTRGAADFKSSPEVENEVRQMVVDWENYDNKVESNDKLQANWALWELTQKWVWEGYKRSLGRVDGFKFDKIWHEHEIYKKGRDQILVGLEKGVFKKTEDGAVVSDLKKDFNLPDTILVKNDGTSLYITQDIELTKLKKETFKADELFWVIGPEQSLAMKQMFAVCSQLGLGGYETFHHIPYGFISIKDKDGKVKKMSSRDGTSIYVDDLIDKAKESIKQKMDQLKKEILNSNEDTEIEKIAIGAIKYALLKVTRTTDQIFDFDTTISFDGDSGPYIMYSYVRAMSLLKKVYGSNILTGEIKDKLKINLMNYKFKNNIERELAGKINSFANEIHQAATTFSPNLICLYIYELSQKFSDFYANFNVVAEADETTKQGWITLVYATSIVIKNGLKLLGIETVETM